MARRLSISEEREIADYLRDHPDDSIRRVAQLFNRSRPAIAALRTRYGLDKPQAPDSPTRGRSGAPSPEPSFNFREEMAAVDRETRALLENLTPEERAQLKAEAPVGREPR